MAFFFFFSLLITGCSEVINKNGNAYCIRRVNDSNCYRLEDFTCDTLCELRGFYNGSYVDFVPMIQSPQHKEKFLVPDFETKRFCGSYENREKAVGCAGDCNEQTKLMNTDEKPVLGNCCCN